MASIKLNKVPYVERYWHIFKRGDGSTFEVETTEADYRQLGQKYPTNPTHPDGDWFCSVARGGDDLKEGEYADNSTQRVLVKIDGDVVPVDRSFMDGDTLTEAGVLEVERIKDNLLRGIR